MTIQVILADDQPLIRAGLRRLIDQTPDIDVAGEAGTGAEAVHLTRDTDPDVVVMDIRMPGMDGIEATQLITAGDTRARVLVLTTFDDDDYVYGALRAGASAFLVKDMALADILAAIRVVAVGDAMIAPGVTRRLIGQFAGQSRPGRKPLELTGITGREREVLRLVGNGEAPRGASRFPGDAAPQAGPCGRFLVARGPPLLDRHHARLDELQAVEELGHLRLAAGVNALRQQLTQPSRGFHGARRHPPPDRAVRRPARP